MKNTKYMQAVIILKVFGRWLTKVYVLLVLSKKFDIPEIKSMPKMMQERSIKLMRVSYLGNVRTGRTEMMCFPIGEK
tara:strand:+ start:205 stop:435 length:231 start_codon:yes stop_codon:yes gene_type:complete